MSRLIKAFNPSEKKVIHPLGLALGLTSAIGRLGFPGLSGAEEYIRNNYRDVLIRRYCPGNENAVTACLAEVEANEESPGEGLKEAGETGCLTTLANQPDCADTLRNLQKEVCSCMREKGKNDLYTLVQWKECLAPEEGQDSEAPDSALARLSYGAETRADTLCSLSTE